MEFFQNDVFTAYYLPDSSDHELVAQLSQQDGAVLADGLAIPEFDLKTDSW
jgi:hypothetical protein